MPILTFSGNSDDQGILRLAALLRCFNPLDCCYIIMNQIRLLII